MRPKERTKAPQNDLFRLKLVNLIDLRHELCRLGENPYWQYFCGEEYFQHRLPIDPSQMTRFRTRLGPSGCEKLLELTIAAGLETRAVKPSSFTQVTVDTTVQ